MSGRRVMQATARRIRRERRTIETMIDLYCREIHGSTGGLCPECSGLFEYALKRLDQCPYREHKPVCSKCPTHCYSPGMREKIRRVMRYSGPRMVLRHPVLSLLHVMDARSRIPRKPEKGTSTSSSD